MSRLINRLRHLVHQVLPTDVRDGKTSHAVSVRASQAWPSKLEIETQQL